MLPLCAGQPSSLFEVRMTSACNSIERKTGVSSTSSKMQVLLEGTAGTAGDHCSCQATQVERFWAGVHDNNKQACRPEIGEEMAKKLND